MRHITSHGEKLVKSIGATLLYTGPSVDDEKEPSQKLAASNIFFLMGFHFLSRLYQIFLYGQQTYQCLSDVMLHTGAAAADVAIGAENMQLGNVEPPGWCAHFLIFCNEKEMYI